MEFSVEDKTRLNLLYFVIIILMLATAAVGAYSVRAYFDLTEMRDLRTSP